MGTESSLDKVRRLIADGAEQVGAAAGVVVGWHVAGPAGALAGLLGDHEHYTHYGSWVSLRHGAEGPERVG